ncbi:tryptophan--tRNA ligase [bacterium]|nr:tryptophan--tRNA ligase [bacterium]
MHQDHEAASRRDHAEKLAIAERERAYYEERMMTFGLSPISTFIERAPAASYRMRRGITYGHKDMEKIADCIRAGKPWAVLSGINPSGPLHFGHKAVFDEIRWLQTQGADVFIPLSDDESYIFNKVATRGQARRFAYDTVIPTLIALGFEPGKTFIFLDSDYTSIYNFAIQLSTKVTWNNLKGVFGFEVGANAGAIFYQGAIQLAHILFPQLPEFGGPRPTVVPVGIDQHPYILLSRDVADKMDMVPPGEMCTKFLYSLQGPEKKMSASLPNTCIFLDDAPEVAEAKIKSAYTGGLPLARVQRELGGVPDICPVFQLLNYHFLSDEESAQLYRDYREGRLLSTELKALAIRHVKTWLAEHREKREEARKRIDEYLVKTPITSILA